MTNPQGGGGPGGGGGSAPTSTPAPQQKKWYDIAYRPKSTNDQSTDEKMRLDTITVNPRWIEPGNAYKESCTRCSATWELRQRGYDVTAGEMNFAARDWTTSAILNKWIDPKTGNRRYKTDVPNKVTESDGTVRYVTADEWLANMEQIILSKGGDGSRGFVVLDWKSGGGHIFNYQVKNGKVEYIEAQDQPLPHQKRYKDWKYEDGWHNRVKITADDNWVMRVDDLEPQRRLLDEKWVLNRTPLEINAPTFDELIVEEVTRFPPASGSLIDQNQAAALQKAFRLGWQQIRSGKRPRRPDEYANYPTLEAAYSDGIMWARRPD